MFHPFPPMLEPPSIDPIEYERFYTLYSRGVRYNLLFRKLLEECANFLPEVFSEINTNINKRNDEIPSLLACVGLKAIKHPLDNAPRSIKTSDIEEIKQHFDGKCSSYLEYIVDSRTYLDFFIAFESTIEDYLIRNHGCSAHGRNAVKKNELLPKLFAFEHTTLNMLSDRMGTALSDSQISKIWQLFVLIRNLYAHNGGYVDETFITRLLELAQSDELANFDYSSQGMVEATSLFQQENENDGLFHFKPITVGEPFVLTPINYNFFVNLIVKVWESILVNFLISKMPSDKDAMCGGAF